MNRNRKRKLAKDGKRIQVSRRARPATARGRRTSGQRQAQAQDRPANRKRLYGDYSAGERDGTAWRSSAEFKSGAEALKKAILDQWNIRYRQTGGNRADSWKQAMNRGKRYASGFMQGAGNRAALTPLPVGSRTAAIVCAGSNEVALQQVLTRLATMPIDEIVIVAGNPTPGIFRTARSCGNAIVACLPDEVHPDVGRALGSKLTEADAVLFVDGERPASSESLAGLLWACGGKWDVALNDLSRHRGSFRQRQKVEWLFEFMNASLNRRDLMTNSLSVLPFALSRRALDALGAPALSVPAKAHAMAILKGLRIGAVGPGIDDGSRAVRQANWRQAAGDHAEAWGEAFQAEGKRLYFADRVRNRSVLGGRGQ